MSRKVLYFIKQPVHTRPPCMMEILTLHDMGIEVAVLTSSCSPEAKAQFAEKGIPCHTFTYKEFPFKPVRKVINYLHYRKVFRDFFRKYWTDDAVFWIGTEQSIVKYRPFLRNIHPVIQNCLEFYEQEWYQEAMPRICREADVTTACEPNRAQFMVDWWHLEKQPYILRNKPYSHPRTPRMEGSTPELREAIAQVQGKKTILYQGAIEADRDLGLLAAALREYNSEYYLVLSGPVKDDSLDRLKAMYDKVLYLGNLPSPFHMELASHADICVAFYKDNSINNRFCAPNKIYEYAGFGAPMLCNPIPGLTETVGAAGAAECVDFHDAKAVIDAIGRIDANPEAYRTASNAFFDNTDNTETLKALLEDAFSKTKAERK